MKPPCRFLHRTGFSLVELLVSFAVLSIIMVVLVSMVNQTATTWQKTSGKIEQFREARSAFEALSRRLSQATLNTYWDYDNPLSPTRYIRQSELRFLSGDMETISSLTDKPRPTHGIFFQAPLGYVEESPNGEAQLENLLNTWGYFVEYGDDSQDRPTFVTAAVRERFRLMELMEPSETLTLYKYTSGMNANGTPKASTYVGREWFKAPLGSADRPVHVLAENIIALLILPKLSEADQAANGYSNHSLAPDYTYDSTATNADSRLNPKNQLPPLLQVTMVAVDEKSAARLDAQALIAKLNTLFGSASQLTSDLQRDPGAAVGADGSLEGYLLQNKIDYRIFSSSISLKSSRWSREQSN